ncbi:MAG: four helix bundle protein [Candidatus Moranbacteria bacterium CG_4_9_14_3_um_filter_42_9]|nr:MAG: four helix bundle protein [Candidatus Moranbacteria bacterium CG_4_9_14_3_um_filter_42_9]
MSKLSYKSNQPNDSDLLFTHGGYRELKSFQMATLVFDLTTKFCDSFIDKRSRTHDQMVQAARSGRQNIAEGSLAAGTSKKTEIKLTNVARASLEELLLDYEDFLRQRSLKLWTKESGEAKNIRNLAYREDKSYSSYQSYLKNPESAANMLICVIHQTNYLLDKQLRKLSDEFLRQGGFTERLYQKRKDYRERN